jgi:hypothetical protein
MARSAISELPRGKGHQAANPQPEDLLSSVAAARRPAPLMAAGPDRSWPPRNQQAGPRLRPGGAAAALAAVPRRPSSVPARLVSDALRSPGEPVPASVRPELEGRLGADLSDVRVHVGRVARVSAAVLGARAYTAGNHVVIGAGPADGRLLAHEMTHVVQQRHGPVAGTEAGGGLTVSDPGDRFEREAEAGPPRAARPAPAAVPGGRIQVQRMLIDVPPAIGQPLNLPAVLDTAGLTDKEILDIAVKVGKGNFGTAKQAADKLVDALYKAVFADDFLKGAPVGITPSATIPTPAPQVPVSAEKEEEEEEEEITPQAPPPAKKAMSPAAPATKQKRPRLNPEFPTVHDNSHFHRTDQKRIQGVWITKDKKAVRKLVNDALDRIYRDQGVTVGPSKPGSTTYVVDMGATQVGYISGSKYDRGTKKDVSALPPATHIVVYVHNTSRAVISAFPGSPGDL